MRTRGGFVHLELGKLQGQIKVGPRLLHALQPYEEVLRLYHHEVYLHLRCSQDETVQTPTGPLDVTRQRNLLASHPDARVREDGFKRRFDGLASRRDLLTFALIHIVKAQDAFAKEHHYSDALERKYSIMGFWR